METKTNAMFCVTKAVQSNCGIPFSGLSLVFHFDCVNMHIIWLIWWNTFHCAYMYVCEHACVHACVHAHVCMCVCVHVHECVFVCVRTCTLCVCMKDCPSMCLFFVWIDDGLLQTVCGNFCLRPDLRRLLCEVSYKPSFQLQWKQDLCDRVI